MNDQIKTLTSGLRAGLESIYGEALKGAYLYGSYARGEQDSQSDVDVLVVLEHIDHYGAEVERTGLLVSELSLKHDVSISRVFVSQKDWLDRQSPFLVNVRGEAASV